MDRLDGPAETGGTAPLAAIDRVLQDSSLYLVGNVATRAIGFLAIPFYAHFLTPAQYGLVELIELGTQTVAIAVGLQAIGSALSRLCYDQRTREDRQALASTALLLTAMLSAAVTLIAIAAAGPLCRLVFYDDHWVGLLRAAFAAMFFSNMTEVVLVYERIIHNARFYLAYTLFGVLAQLALNILFIGVLEAGVWGFVVSKLVVTLCGCLYLALRTRRRLGFHLQFAHLPELIRFGAPLVASSVAYLAIHFSDRLFIGSIVSLAELGRYAIAYRFATLVSALVGDSFSKSWAVILYRYVDRPDWRERFAQAASTLTYVLFTTGLAIALFSPELLRIMVPPDYAPPPMLLPIIIAAYLAREVGDFFRALLFINERPGLVGRIAVCTAILNLAVNALLIPAYGLHGAAIATLATWLAYMTVCWVSADREHHLPIVGVAYLRLIVLLVVVYALAEGTRGTSLAFQLLLDGLWSLLFCAIAPAIFLTPAERAGALALAGSLGLRSIAIGSLPPGTAPHGPRRLLMLAYYYPPQNEIGAARPDRFARYLRREGLDVTVVTSAPAEDPQIGAAAQPRQPHILRPSAAAPATGPFPWPLRAGGTLLHGIERMVLPYDDRLAWFPHAFATASQALTSGTILFSTHPPTVTHLAALAIKLRHGTPWIADFRDPLWGNPYRTAQRASLIDPVLERLIVENADALIANTDASADLLRARYPAFVHKLHVIWNGYDPEDGLNPAPRPPAQHRPTRRVIAHVGTLYGNRTPLAFLAALERLVGSGAIDPATILFRQVGRADPSCLDPANPVLADLAARGCCETLDRNVPAAQARREMMEAEWLLLLDMNLVNPGLQVPAKTFDYVRTGRPILALTVPGSPTERVLRLAATSHACLNVAAEPAVFDAAMLDFLNRPTHPTSPSAAFLAEFEAPRQARHLLTVVDSVARPP